MMHSLFKTIFDKSYTGMALLGKGSEIILSNKTFSTMAGFDIKQMSAIRVSQLIMPEDKLRLEGTLQRISDEELNHTSDTYRKMDRKSEVYWQVDFHYLREDESGKKFIFAIINDITEQKKGHEELKSAKDAAEKSTRDKSDFLANMSHEIRTPIHTILGMNEMLLETALDPEQMEYGEQVRFAAEVLLGLINDILDVSKIEAGKLELEKISFDLYQMTEDTIDMVSLEAHKKNLEVILDIHEGVHRQVIGDPVRLRQIIVNLFNNSVKFTRQGEIITTIEKVEEDDKQTTLKFTVRDSGIGIPEDKVGKLFKAFTQVDSSTTRKFGGTGLGLSISQNLARLMNGQIGVESEFGKGSAFWFTTKMDRVEQEPVCMPIDEDMQGVKVLVVDDHSAAREVLVRFLQEWGYNVYASEGGSQALSMLREHSRKDDPFHACLVDLLMPGMDGWQLGSEINADKEINYTKLLLFSPTGKSGDEAKMKLLHWFDIYLSKPYKKIKIYKNLAGVLADDVDLESVDEIEEGEQVSAGEFPDDVVTISASILIAEDHEVNQQLFKAILESMGHEAAVANNGAEAVEIASRQSFDVIFMDVQMPEMNGYEATEHLREMGITTPIIAATASAVKEEREKCSAVGMDDLLIKPFKKADVVPLLRKWLPKKDESAVEQEEIEGVEIVDAEELSEFEELEEIDELEEDSAPDEVPMGVSEPDMPVIDETIFDLEQAVETFMGKKEVVIKVLRLFVEKVEEQIPIMDEALKSGDLETLRGEAHSIKGGGLSLQVIRVGNKAKELEDASREKRGEDAALFLSELKELYKELIDHVAPFLENERE